jgi:hypothetical protein
MELMTASEPTAMMGGTLKIEISSGSKTTPPPIPVDPMSIPARRPMPALVAMV